MGKKIRETLRFDLENVLSEAYMMNRSSNFRIDQKQEAADTLNAFIRVYNYYTKPKDQISLLGIIDSSELK